MGRVRRRRSNLCGEPAQLPVAQIARDACHLGLVIRRLSLRKALIQFINLMVHLGKARGRDEMVWADNTIRQFLKGLTAFGFTNKGTAH